MSQTLELKKVLLPGVCAALLLSGCGGSSSSSTTVRDETPPPEDTSSGNDDFTGTVNQPYLVGDDATLKAGVFLADITYNEQDDQGDPVTAEALMSLSATGNFTFVFDPETITVGTLTLDETAINASVTDYAFINDMWSESERGTITGSVDSQGTAVLEPGGRIAKVEINRVDEEPGQILDFETISGTYTMSRSGSLSSITIGTDGVITGSVSDCVLNGQVKIPVPGQNVYELSYTASNCDNLGNVTRSQRNGQYVGVGTFDRDSNIGTGDIDFAASNGKIAFFFAGTR